jgi:hypothetical protein
MINKCCVDKINGLSFFLSFCNTCQSVSVSLTASCRCSAPSGSQGRPTAAGAPRLGSAFCTCIILFFAIQSRAGQRKYFAFCVCTLGLLLTKIRVFFKGFLDAAQYNP